MLELDEGQLSRPVLRGRGGSNTSLLPGRSVDGSSQRGRACARPDPAGEAGAKELWPMASECEAEELAGIEKRQNKGPFPKTRPPARRSDPVCRILTLGELAPWQCGHSAIGDSRQTRLDRQGRNPRRLTGGPKGVEKCPNEPKILRT